VHQKSAVLHALQPAKDLFVLLPTGGGKSLLFMLPAFIMPDKLCVVVVPLVSLQQDLIHRCARKGITAARFADFANTAGVRIVLVSAEQLVLPSYTAFIRTAAATQSLHAIFIDEAHLVLLWKHFRPALGDVREFIRPHDVTVPIIAMTATCPPPLVHSMSHACGMRNWQVLRSPTTRANIRYSVREVPASKMLLAAAQLIGTIATTTTESNDTAAPHPSSIRLIVYIQNKLRCNAVEHVLSLICPDIQCLLYHADLSDVQRTKALQQWQAEHATKLRLMVATSAFGCGIDVPSVRCVVHLGLPTTVIDFLQESGRAGRDGSMAHSIIFHQPLSSNAANSAQSHAIQTTKDDLIAPAADACPPAPSSTSFGVPSALCTTPKNDCRRWFLDTFADGATDRRSCQSRHLEPCDHCQAQFGQATAAAEATTSTPFPDDDERQTKRQPQRENDSGDGDGGGGTTGAGNGRNDVTHATGSSRTEFVSGNDALNAALRPATPAALRAVAETLFGTCPPCSIATRSLVRHTTQSVQCFNNICLRCCAKGHKASVCPNLTLPVNTVGCYTCTLNKINGMVVHNAGTYGKRSCQLKSVFCYCICIWECDELRALTRQHIPCTAHIHTTSDYVHWLRNGTATDNQLGILHMVPLLQSIFFNSQTDR